MAPAFFTTTLEGEEQYKNVYRRWDYNQDPKSNQGYSPTKMKEKCMGTYQKSRRASLQSFTLRKESREHIQMQKNKARPLLPCKN